MKRLAIVPARGGSKRLSGKNTRLLCGKPLINHTVDVARTCFDQVIVSSDSAAILELISPTASVTTNQRPPELATDESKVIDTVNYYFNQYELGVFDQIWLCLPTCPLRTTLDLASGISLLTDEFDGILSVTDYEFPPSLGLTIINGLLTGADSRHPLASGNSRSQDQEKIFRPNGAFYGMWWDSFAKNRNFYRGKVKEYFMPRDRSVDIDTELDFLLAELIMQRSSSK